MVISVEARQENQRQRQEFVWGDQLWQLSILFLFLYHVLIIYRRIGGEKVLINTNLEAKEKLYNPTYVLQKIYILPKPWNERISIFSSPMSTEAGYENWN